MRVSTKYMSVPGTAHEYEDRVLVDEERKLYCVADGVTISSQGSGGVAAELAVKLISEFFSDNLADAVLKVNKKIIELKASDTRIGETTLTAAHIKDGQMEIVNVGDSPALLLRNNRITYLTVQDRSVFGYITQVVGLNEGINVHKNGIRLQEKDIVIIASDGVQHVLNETLLGIIKRSGFSELAREIVNAATIYPSSYDDDKSVIVIQVHED